MKFIDNISLFLYKFLFHPKHKKWRYGILILMLTLISINTILDFRLINAGMTLFHLILYALFTLSTYLIAVYIVVIILVPKFLLTQKEGTFMAYLFLSIFLLITIQFISEYSLFKFYGVEKNFNSSLINPFVKDLIQFISFFLLTLIAFSGVLLTIFLKQWTVTNLYSTQIEKKYAQTKVNQLKEQLNPDFLFKTLARIRTIEQENPNKATSMVLTLSHLLRYQLYDCNRKLVFLSSEIQFLTNYLNLEKLYNDRLKYEISTGQTSYPVRVPPLIFMPFVQQIINDSFHLNHSAERTIYIGFSLKNNTLTFQCQVNSPIFQKDDSYHTSIERLKLLYNDTYRLEFIEPKNNTHTGIKLQINV